MASASLPRPFELADTSISVALVSYLIIQLCCLQSQDPLNNSAWQHCLQLGK